MINKVDDIKKILTPHIEELVEEFNINIIYVFGSYAKGTNTEKSDIDIAVLIDGEVDRYTQLNVLGALIDIFKREDIDLVILNNANEVLKFQVIKYSKIIYMDSLYTKVMFESTTMSRYMDMEYFRKTQEKYTHKRFLEVVD